MKARILNKIVKDYKINPATFDVVMSTPTTDRTGVTVGFAWTDGNCHHNWIKEVFIRIDPAQADDYATNGAEAKASIRRNK